MLHRREMMRLNTFVVWCILLSFFFCLQYLKTSDNTLFWTSQQSETSRHPPMCLSLENDENRKEPNWQLQEYSSTSEIWDLLACCFRQYSSAKSVGDGEEASTKDAVVCGRFGCCPGSCYANIKSTSSRALSAKFPSSEYKSFMVETSNRNTLSFRQACAVESLAALNPRLRVHVLMTNDTIDEDSPTVSTLKKHYENVIFHSIYSTGDFFMGTFLERWYFCSGWNYGPFPISHLSEALRVLLLYLFGGYYFDADVIMIHPIPDYLNKNYVSFEDFGSFGSAILHMEKGHPFMELAVKDFAENYRTDSWTHNSNSVVQRSMEKWCNASTASLAVSSDTCKDISILPHQHFFPVRWEDYEDYFQVSSRKIPELRKIFNESVIGAHVWNKMSAEYKINKQHSKHQLVAKIASSKCPHIFSIAPDTF